jgi:short-subunit dehydrogenase
MPTYFVDTPLQEMDDILTININATLHVTQAVLPSMIQRQVVSSIAELFRSYSIVNRKRGLILNMGSFAGAFGSPMLATYSASKAFLSTFTTALGDELKLHNITVEYVNTYYVVSVVS